MTIWTSPVLFPKPVLVRQSKKSEKAESHEEDGKESRDASFAGVR